MRLITVSAAGAAARTDSAGLYQLTVPAAGTYTVTPSATNYTFLPASQSVTVGADRSGIDFAATRLYHIGGHVMLNGAGLSDVTVTAGGTTVPTDSRGAYTFTVTEIGSYLVSARKEGFVFTPGQRTAVVGPDQSGVDFEARSTAASLSLGPPCLAAA